MLIRFEESNFFHNERSEEEYPMSRKRKSEVREVLPDPKFQDIVITKFMNTLMIGGKKSIAEKIFYGALDLVQEKTGEEPLKVFSSSSLVKRLRCK